MKAKDFQKWVVKWNSPQSYKYLNAKSLMPPPMVHVLIILNFKIYIYSYLSQNVIPLLKNLRLPHI